MGKTIQHFWRCARTFIRNPLSIPQPGNSTKSKSFQRKLQDSCFYPGGRNPQKHMNHSSRNGLVGILCVVNLLAYLTLGAYRSAISSVHDKIDVGQHPLVTRFLKGAFHQRSAQLRYTQTWDMRVVSSYIRSQGENKSLGPITQVGHVDSPNETMQIS